MSTFLYQVKQCVDYQGSAQEEEGTMQQKKKLGHICSVMRDAENRTRGKLLDGHAWLHVKKMCICLKVCLSVNWVEYTFPNPTKEGAPCGSRPTRDKDKCMGVLHESSGNDPNTHTPVVGKDNRLLEALQHLDCVPARGSSEATSATGKPRSMRYTRRVSSTLGPPQ